jgi:hypothetical protein
MRLLLLLHLSAIFALLLGKHSVGEQHVLHGVR